MAQIAVAHTDLMAKGGGEGVCLNVIEALQNDHEVTLLTLTEPDLRELNDYFQTDVHDADEGPFHVLPEQLGRSATTAQNVVAGAIETIRVYGEEQVEEKLDRHRENSADGHYYLFDEAAKVIERGKQPPVPLGQSYWVLELMEQVRADAKERSDI